MNDRGDLIGYGGPSEYVIDDDFLLERIGRGIGVSVDGSADRRNPAAPGHGCARPGG